MTDDKVGIDVLAAIIHPVRRRIIEYLFLEGPSQVGTLATALEQQVGSISHHLRMLERAEVVERAPELAVDGRTSWWRYIDRTRSWSVEDFTDSPADLYRARVAEKRNVQHQVAKLADWKTRESSYDESWRRAAFSIDSLTRCTAGELQDLLDRLMTTHRQWHDEVVARHDGVEREPVFWFAHAFPTTP